MVLFSSKFEEEAKKIIKSVDSQSILFLDGRFSTSSVTTTDKTPKVIETPCIISRINGIALDTPKKRDFFLQENGKGRSDVKLFLKISNDFPVSSSSNPDAEEFYLVFSDNRSLKVSLNRNYLRNIKSDFYILVTDNVNVESNDDFYDESLNIENYYDKTVFNLIDMKTKIWSGSASDFKKLKNKYEDVLYFIT